MSKKFLSKVKIDQSVGRPQAIEMVWCGAWNGMEHGMVWSNDMEQNGMLMSRHRPLVLE